MNVFRVVLVLFLSFWIVGCDFYTLYFIKKSLEGDFSYVDKFSSKYSLKGDSFSDIPISDEERILPEFVEDKIKPMESEKDFFPGSKEKVSYTEKIFSKKGDKVRIKLQDNNGVWIVKKYPLRVSYLDLSSDVKNNEYIFVVSDFGKDNAIFNLFSSNGNVIKVLEYEIEVIQNNVYSLDSSKSFRSDNGKKISVLGTNDSSNNDVKFDITDNEKNESGNDVKEPIPPSDVGKLDLKSLVGNEEKFFESIDNISKKYGYYRALKEIESIEANVSKADLPKLKLKKMEILGNLKKFSDAIKEGEGFVDKDSFIALYTGIFWGMSKNYNLADKYIKDALQKIVVPREISFALSKAIDYYKTIPEPPTREILNFLIQKNEIIKKDFNVEYYKNLSSIASLYERIGEIYKARSIYELIFSAKDVSDDLKDEVSSKITNLEKILNP